MSTTREEKTACSKTNSSPSKWPYFSVLNEFFATNPLHNTSQLRESHIPHCSKSVPLQLSQEDSLQQSNIQNTDVTNYAETLHEPLFSNVEIESEISVSQASCFRIAEDHDYLPTFYTSQQSSSNIPSNSITDTPKQGNKRPKESNDTSTGKKKRLTYEERMLQCLENTTDLILKNQDRIIKVMETQNSILKRMFPEQ